MIKNLAWRFVEDVYVGAHTAKPPSQPEWDSMLEQVLQNGRIRVGLIYTEGGSPSALQRKQLRDVTERLNMRGSAILTSSVVARAAITAINLFSKDFSAAFPPHHIENALRHLGVSVELWPTIKKELAAVKRELSITLYLQTSL
jgi:hypothetical protein